MPCISGTERLRKQNDNFPGAETKDPPNFNTCGSAILQASEWLTNGVISAVHFGSIVVRCFRRLTLRGNNGTGR
jgi:hypothetical protein